MTGAPAYDADTSPDAPASYEDLMAAYNAGYEQGLATRLDLDIDDAVQARLHARAADVIESVMRTPVRRPNDITATSDELTAKAEQRRAAGIARFRADHARRRSA